MADAPTYSPSTDVMPILNKINTPQPNPEPTLPVATPEDAAAQTAAAQAPIPQAAPPTPQQAADATNPQHGKIGTVLQDIAGGKTTDYVQGPSGPVAVKRNLQPGEIARNILASAFSLMAAGSGGDLAAREHRPFVQPESQTIGGMEQQRIQQREQEADKEYQQQRQASQDELNAHQAALEQQKAIGEIQKQADDHRQFQLTYQNELNDRSEHMQAVARQHYDQLVTDTQLWNQTMAEPGAEVMKDANGNALAFYDHGKPGDADYQSAGQQLQAYMLKNPQLLHGSTNGNIGNKYSVIPRVNPTTGALQIIDLPADRNDKGIINAGQAVDKDGKLLFNKDGSPKPDGTILDPVTHEPTVLTETVTAAQLGDIRKQQISLADIESQMRERDAMTRFRDAQIKAMPELGDALKIFNEKGMSALTPKQVTELSTMYGREYTIANQRLNEATTALAKARTNAAGDDSDPSVQAALGDFENAQKDYNDIKGQYDTLTGLTPGIKVANSIIRQGVGKQSWANIDKQISDSTLTDDEKSKAKAKVWNSLSPAQQAAARGQTAQEVNTPSAGTTKTAPGPDGKMMDVIIDPEGGRHFVPLGKADAYLALPKYKGWSK